MKQFLLKNPSPISVSTHRHLIINGKFTKFIVPKWLDKLIVKFLNWRYETTYNN